MEEHIKTTVEIGKNSEDLAVAYLENKGYQILERNWRSGHKEIDIIALDGDMLVIVEVKSRKSLDFGDPDVAVGVMKQRMLIYAAEAYINYHNLDLEVRFDIISMIITPQGEQIEHIEDAFCPVVR